MNELMIAKIDELMNLEIEGETRDESDSRDYILGTLKCCISQAGDKYISSVRDKDQDRTNRIAMQQTIHTFEALRSGAGLADMSRDAKSRFQKLLSDLLEMTYGASSEETPTTMRSIFGAMSPGAYDD